jgi:hypothetical protein
MLPIKPMPEVDKSTKHPTELRQQSTLQKFISFAFGRIAALWPSDSREWALAMQAELPQMESTQESLQWLAGGIMSLFKAWWNGALYSGSNKELAPVKKPGILSALVTVAALALLLIPSANQGLRAVITSWQPQRDRFEAYQVQIQRLAREAESRGDAKTMAFAAIHFESRKDFVSLANKAVALDPSLTWIYSQGYQSDSWVPEARDWGTKLEAWDPGNGFAYLVKAQIRNSELVRDGKWVRRSWGDAAKFDPQWMECGRKAMESPRYDSYYKRRIQFDREVMRTHRLKDPYLVFRSLVPSLWATRWPVYVYSQTVLDEAKAAVARGDKQTATRDAWAVAHFGELLRAQGATEWERVSSVEYLRPAYTILQPLLAAEGRSDEAAMLSQELETIKPGAPATLSSSWPDDFGYGWGKAAGVAIDLGVASAVLFAIALLFAGIWLYAARFAPSMSSGAIYRMACRIGRYSPAGLLVSLAVLAASYRPVTDAVGAYLYYQSNWDPNGMFAHGALRSAVEAFSSVYYVPGLFWPSPRPSHHATFWLIATVFVLTVTIIIARNIFNRTTRPKAA